MKVYLVGGAVRDKLLGIPAQDHDYVVIDTTPEELKYSGYIEVGKGHKVFLNPETREEYTLAESLIKDLERRDLTINAMAMDGENLIDYFGGQKDLQNKILRAVKEDNFFTDPLRVYRLARFQVQFPDFHIHPETLKLIQGVCQSDAFINLDRERIFGELRKALTLSQSKLFFDVLFQNRIQTHFELFQIEDFKYLNLSLEAEDKFATLFFNHDHEETKNFCDNLKVPNYWKEKALLGNRLCQKLENLKTPEEKVRFLQERDVYRRPIHLEIMKHLLSIMGKKDLIQKSSDWYEKTAWIGIKDISPHLSGKEIGEELTRKRIEILSHSSG